jgi:hypothetical protein
VKWLNHQRLLWKHLPVVIWLNLTKKNYLNSLTWPNQKLSTDNSRKAVKVLDQLFICDIVFLANIGFLSGARQLKTHPVHQSKTKTGNFKTIRKLLLRLRNNIFFSSPSEQLYADWHFYLEPK